MKKLFLPIIDNGIGLSRTNWAIAMFALGISSVLKQWEIVATSISYPYPDGAMNIATHDFLESDCDRMLVIDTDIIFTPKQVEWILSHDAGFVAGIYPKKKEGLELCCAPLNGQNPFAPDPLAEGVRPLVEVARVGKGFINVHRDVFEALKSETTEFDGEGNRKMREYWRTLRGGHSEDFDFCDRIRAHGFKVYVDQRCTLRHEGSAIYPIKGTW